MNTTSAQTVDKCEQHRLDMLLWQADVHRFSTQALPASQRNGGCTMSNHEIREISKIMLVAIVITLVAAVVLGLALGLAGVLTAFCCGGLYLTLVLLGVRAHTKEAEP